MSRSNTIQLKPIQLPCRRLARCLLALLVLTSQCAAMQTTTKFATKSTTKSTTKSMTSHSKVSVDQSTLKVLLAKAKKQHGVPAIAAAVVRHGEVVASGVLGSRKFGSKISVTLNDQFHLGSCTKAITATLIGILVDEGKLSWDTTVAEAFPRLGNKIRPEYLNVTVEDLLHHRAGLPHTTLPNLSLRAMHALRGTPAQQRYSYATAILSSPPHLPPRTKTFYSNAGYAIAGVIAERAAKSTWEKLISERIFKPLNMKSAGFGSMGTRGKIDQPLQHSFRDGVATPVEPGRLSDNPVVIGPAGRIHCSIGDWAKFIGIFTVDPKSQKLLRPETILRIQSAGSDSKYASGWLLAERDWGDGTVLTHNGSNTMNYAVSWIAPKRQFAVIVMTNQGGQEASTACDQVASGLITHFLSK